jgi:hypothetical protein
MVCHHPANGNRAWYISRFVRVCAHACVCVHTFVYNGNMALIGLWYISRCVCVCVHACTRTCKWMPTCIYMYVLTNLWYLSDNFWWSNTSRWPSEPGSCSLLLRLFAEEDMYFGQYVQYDWSASDWVLIFFLCDSEIYNFLFFVLYMVCFSHPVFLCSIFTHAWVIFLWGSTECL